jgi:hypothetical protein
VSANVKLYSLEAYATGGNCELIGKATCGAHLTDLVSRMKLANEAAQFLCRRIHAVIVASTSQELALSSGHYVSGWQATVERGFLRR